MDHQTVTSIGTGGYSDLTGRPWVCNKERSGGFLVEDRTDFLSRLIKETGDYGLPGLVDPFGAITLGFGCNNNRGLNFEFLVVLNGEYQC